MQKDMKIALLVIPLVSSTMSIFFFLERMSECMNAECCIIIMAHTWTIFPHTAYWCFHPIPPRIFCKKALSHYTHIEQKKRRKISIILLRNRQNGGILFFPCVDLPFFHTIIFNTSLPSEQLFTEDVCLEKRK